MFDKKPKKVLPQKVPTPTAKNPQKELPSETVLPCTPANLDKYRKRVNICKCGHPEQDHTNGTGACQKTMECTCKAFKLDRIITMRKQIYKPTQVKEFKYSFYQEMLIRSQMPTPSGISLFEQLKTGALSQITITYEKGLYVLRTK
jgi:hypothetical protein